MRRRHDIQGNILRGYASHCHAAYLLAAITRPAEARSFVTRLVEDDRIATERDWHEPPVTRLNVAFTYRGLERLHPRLDAFAAYEDFRQGMSTRARTYLGDLGANDPARWDDALCRETHALFTVYGDSVDTRDRATDGLAADLADAGWEVVHDQRADMLEGNREHFGFTDGFSQPALPGVSETRRSRRGEGVQHSRLRRVWEGEWRDVRLGEFVLGHKDEDGVVPGERQPLLLNGTFMVWRKLEQDVDAFNAWIHANAGGGADAQTTLKARILGRWPDGVSLIRRPASADGYAAPPADADAPHEPQINDFTYGDDADGLRCPLGAHVRRANPRDALGFYTERTRRNRIIRRGMPYADTDGTRGLIFVCFNASITRQFEQIQGHWLMAGDTFGLGSERDFLTAGLDPGQASERMTLQGDRSDPPRFITRERQFVTVRGGHYLFVPGIAALRRIAAG
ncbi:MAG: Dyp-type peroxidase [Solirubrobacteraceae bacterium]